jgi:hypothetical protein
MKRFPLFLTAITVMGLGCPNHPSGGQADAGPSPTIDSGTPSDVPPEVTEEFERHYQAWQSFVDSPKMRLSSDTYQLTNHPEYQAIVAMGKKALPLVIAKLAEGDFLMVNAVEQITRINVFQTSGKTLQPGELLGEQGESLLWVEWWQQNRSRPEWQP